MTPWTAPASFSIEDLPDASLLCREGRVVEANRAARVAFADRPLLGQPVSELLAGFAVTAAETPAGRLYLLRPHAEAEPSFRTLVEAAPDAVLVHADGVVLFANAEAEALLGEPALVGASLDRFTAPGAWVPDGHERHVVERSFRRRDGAERTGECSTLPLRWHGRDALLTFVRDVSDRKRLEAHVLTTDRMATIGTLAAGVVHDISNPVAAALVNLEILDGRMNGTTPVDSVSMTDAPSLLRETRVALVRVAEMARDLKLLAYPNAVQAQSVDVNRVLESCMRMARVEIRKRARLIPRLGNVPPAAGSEARLAQVFLNLMTNAAQAIPEGHPSDHEIVVTTAFVDGRVVVGIRDTGVGVDPSLRDRLFTPFFTTKPAGVGTGLGLSICHRIVTGLGGNIRFEQPEGPGTVVRVDLPAWQATDAPPAVAAAPRRARVLVVDDDAQLGAALARVLGAVHDVSVETTAEDALRRIRGGARFDTIFCDVFMPERSGPELHGDLMWSAPDQAGRIVFLSADPAGARALLGTLPNPCLDKPVAPETLLAMVQKVAYGR